MHFLQKLQKKELLFLLILFLLSLPIILPLLHSGFIVTDDGDLMLIRFTAFHQELANLQFPVRYLTRLNFQYGYPVTNFLYPGFLYIAEVFHLLHFGFINSVKIVIIFSLLGSSFFTYLWLREHFEKFPSLIGSLVFLYAPYHFFDLYKRGSVGELLALAVVSFTLWAIEKKMASLIVLGLSLLILSHNTLALLFLPLLFLYYAWNYDVWNSKKQVVRGVGLFCLSLCVSAFFWIPAIYDLRYTVFLQTKVSDIGDYFQHPDTSLFAILSVVLIIVLIGLSLLYRKKVNILSAKEKLLGGGMIIVSLVTLFFNTSFSFYFWNILPISSFIQFPFRLLSVTIICFAWLVSCFLTFFKGKYQIVLGLLFFGLLTFPTLFLLSHIQYTTKDDMYYATNEDTTTTRNEYLPIWVKERTFARPEEMVIGKNIQYLGNAGGLYKIAIDGVEARKIIFNKVFFPGWVAYGNGEKLSLTYDNPKGLMEIDVPANTPEVTLRFSETPVRLMSDIISLLGIGVLCFLVFNDVKLLYATRKK